MYRKLFYVLVCFLAAAGFACQSSETPNANVNVNVAVDPGNLPPGFSTSPVTGNGANTPGIPDAKNANVIPKGTTPTPGIPDPKTIGKTPMPKGTPPIPGIPDEETLKKQMNRVITNSNAVNSPPPSSKSSVKSPIDRQRTVRKP